jgi:hypothetical protein
MFAITAVFLPVIGAAVRSLAFTLDPAIPPSVAIAMPIPELAATGFWALLAPAVILLLMTIWARAMAGPLHESVPIADWVYGWTRFERSNSRKLRKAMREIGKLERETETMQPTTANIEKLLVRARAKADEARAQQAIVDEWRVRLNEIKAAESGGPWAPMRLHAIVRLSPGMARSSWLLLGPWALFAAISLLFGPFPSGVLNLLVGMGATVMLLRTAASSGRVSLGSVWPIAAILLVVSAATAGLNPTFSDRPANYAFSEPSAVDDGAYVRIGESAGLQYLRSCSNDATFGVPVTSIESLEYLPQPSTDEPTLVGWFSGSLARVGFVASCPNP